MPVHFRQRGARAPARRRSDSNVSLTPPPGEQPPYRIQRDGRDMPHEELPMQYAIAHRTHVTNDIEIVRADGTVVYVQNDVEPLYDAQGEICGCVSVCVDMTERKRVGGRRCARPTGARTNSWPRCRTSCETRSAPIRNALEVLRRRGHDPRPTERALAIMERQLRQLVRI